MHPSDYTPKAIFFDLDETLVENKIPVADLFARMYFDFEEQLGSDNKKIFFEALRAEIGSLWNSMFDSEETPEQLLVNAFARAIGSIEAIAPPQRDTLAAQMLDRYVYLSSNNVVLHNGALETLARLSERGYITGLITNGIERIQLGKIHQLELHKRVDHVNVSAQARAHKPHAPVFEMALEKAGIAASHAWQIGDHPTNDVAGAIRAGMGGVFYNPKQHELERAFAQLTERPTHEIHQLTELLDLLDPL